MFFVCLFVSCWLAKRGVGYKDIWQMGLGDKGNSLVYPFNKYIFEQFVTCYTRC